MKKPLSSLSTSSYSSSPGNLTNDSGFDSIGDLSSNTTAGAHSIKMKDQVSSSSSSSVLLESSAELHDEEETPEITLSFIATPDQTTINKYRLATTGSSRSFNTTCRSNTEELLDSFQEDDGNGEDEDSTNSSRLSSAGSWQGDQAQYPLLVKCPNCKFSFCSKCQCTEHPGRPCKEIDGDITTSVGTEGSNNYSKDLRLSKKRTKGELRRAARL